MGIFYVTGWNYKRLKYWSVWFITARWGEDKMQRHFSGHKKSRTSLCI